MAKQSKKASSVSLPSAIPQPGPGQMPGGMPMGMPMLSPQQLAAIKGNAGQMPMGQMTPEATKELEEKLKKVKKQIETFQKAICKKFDEYIVGVGLLPPPKPREGQPEDKDKVYTLVLVDDTDSKKMSKIELKNKLLKIMDQEALAIDKNILPEVYLLSEIWQSCYDGKYDLLQLIALAHPIYDKGMLAAIKIAELHKSMVIKKFEHYIISYVLAGSLVKGKATQTSDIDVWIVIDDTDVKKMTRAELKDKLRAIIIGMGLDAGDMTGIRNKLNIQVYILTDFWESLREANPIIFTLLRDGIPLYDRGIFMPWKNLLRMGKIKPSTEAIDMFMSSGEQMMKRVDATLKAIGMEDIYYACLTPSQAALMLYGIAPPSPRETPELFEEIFVKKEKLIDAASIKTLAKVIQVRKDLEHGTKKTITGKEIDSLVEDAQGFLKKLKELFSKIEQLKDEEGVLKIYEDVVTMIRDVMRLEGIEKVEDAKIVATFEKELINSGKVPAKYLRMMNNLVKAKKDYDTKKLSKTDISNVKKESTELVKFLVEYVQRKRGRELERAKIRVKHGNRFGEVILLDTQAFIIHDIDHEEKEVSKAKLNAEGSIGTPEKSSLEEFEKAIAKVEIPPKVFIKEPLFEDLKNIFGRDVEVLVNY